tara:strand:- start:343 stop:657 length:315 start_codon:yes stop_codon:yes gene_type:complete
MSSPTRPNDVTPKSERQQASKPVRLGKPLPSMLVRGRRRNSNASIWILAICIAIALILRTIPEADSREVPQSYLPGMIEYLEDADIVEYRAIGAPAFAFSGERL